jgi:hypothetical protein
VEFFPKVLNQLAPGDLLFALLVYLPLQGAEPGLSPAFVKQAFSADGGKTWDVNWIAVDTRFR